MSGSSSEPLMEHERFMQRALELAEQARGRTSPNPLVGCVVVRDNEIVGEGYHARAGEAHAEVVALRQAGEQAKGATVYVTLEPCNHTGRTPPCTEALLEAGVRRVVVAATDPDPRVNGAGIRRLVDAGLEVVTGVMREEAELQNEPFRTVHTLARPLVLYKTAMTLDGKIATQSGQSRWITGPEARALVHAWRNELDAVAVGINTVLRDDPALTTRLEGGRTPLKVVFDSVARTPTNARLFADDEHGEPARVLVFTTEKATKGRVEALTARGAEVALLPALRGRPRLLEALAHLKEKGANSLLLEGGGTLAWSFFEAQAVDKVAVFIGPKFVGGAGASPLAGLGVNRMEDAIVLSEINTRVIAHDLLVTGRVDYRQPEQEQEKT